MLTVCTAGRDTCLKRNRNGAVRLKSKLLLCDSTFHTRLSLTKSSPHCYVRYGHEHFPGSARAIRYCAPSIPFEATPLLSHIGDSSRVTVSV
ncbi:hypothetical protein QVD17_19592 [Tagetes erecta]|uniref:Uncharacterized protein n=1 Tax=Tagetes erecta TaxID=13708 RepID=A0AAD8KJV5_TARER|nr:hypothetical protein QVD17_19592 [Tagetes erecta]